MTALTKRQVWTSLPRYKLIEWIFQDQFWNKVKWVQCPCWMPWIEHKFKYYTNYWWPVTKRYACDRCLKDWWEDHRVNRVKSKVWQVDWRTMRR